LAKRKENKKKRKEKKTRRLFSKKREKKKKNENEGRDTIPEKKVIPKLGSSLAVARNRVKLSSREAPEYLSWAAAIFLLHLRVVGEERGRKGRKKG